MAADPTAFSVWHRDASGAVDYKYVADDPPHPFYVVVERCINICRKMLEHPDAQRTFVTLAEGFEKARQGAPASYKMSSKDVGDVEKKTKDFFGKILTQFPTVIVDYTMREPDVPAIHARRDWVGNENRVFNPSRQCILLNGQRVGHMAGAAARAGIQNDPKNKLQLNQYLFTYSTVLLHELAHVLITYLGQGRSHTPEDEINEGSVAGAPPRKEAGRRLESLLLGGTMNVYRDPIEGTEDKLSGVPFLSRDDGLYRIDQETIDKIAGDRIEFPYRYSGPPKQEEDLEDMASNHTGQTSDTTNPFDDPGVEDIVSRSVQPPSNIDIDNLWHPARRS